MGWTLKHSQNAVAAKARKRIAGPDFSNESRRKIRMPRGRVRFTLTIEDHQIGAVVVVADVKVNRHAVATVTAAQKRKAQHPRTLDPRSQKMPWISAGHPAGYN